MKNIFTLALLGTALVAGSIYAATCLSMKCQSQACGFTTEVTLGPTMEHDFITGYCRACQKFVSLLWRYHNIDDSKEGLQSPPKPTGEVWNPKTGEILLVYACPHCKGPFLQIESHDELKHCPKCNKPQFNIDRTQPEIAVD